MSQVATLKSLFLFISLPLHKLQLIVYSCILLKYMKKTR